MGMGNNIRAVSAGSKATGLMEKYQRIKNNITNKIAQRV